MPNPSGNRYPMSRRSAAGSLWQQRNPTDNQAVELKAPEASRTTGAWLRCAGHIDPCCRTKSRTARVGALVVVHKFRVAQRATCGLARRSRGHWATPGEKNSHQIWGRQGISGGLVAPSFAAATFSLPTNPAAATCFPADRWGRMQPGGTALGIETPWPLLRRRLS